MKLPPPTPTHVAAVELTEAQRARMGRLVFAIWSCGSPLDNAGILAYAERCFLKTVRRGDGGAFEDVARVSTASGLSLVVR